ncbi:MAG TPA: hypothetical protein VMB21_18280 [Candidatus Limnocylindria bacterium]|jgi:hypothetical protein|nr:hypothetical protein [Candidatus Limnocylindria bacterium]
MKRSQQVRLVLTGVVASALWMTGCQQEEDETAVTGTNAPLVLSTNEVYANDDYVPGAGYYHAPYGGWYSRPFNTYLPGRGYYHGGDWWPAPYSGPVTASAPRPEAVVSANLKAQPLQTGTSGIRSSGGSSSDSGSHGRSGNLGSAHAGTSRGGFGGSHSGSAS